MDRHKPPAGLAERSRCVLEEITSSALNERMTWAANAVDIVVNPDATLEVASFVAAYPELNRMTTLAGNVMKVSDVMCILAGASINAKTAVTAPSHPFRFSF
jgi:hypothetical protein